MRSLSFIASVLLAGSAYAQAPSAVFTPTERDLSVPTYINATVVKVDNRNHTVRFRSASGELSLAVDRSAVRDLGRLRAGDQVILGYETDDLGGRPVQIVTAILSNNTPGNGTVSTVSSVPPSFSTVTGRVVSADPASGTIVLADALGRTELLSVSGVTALGMLGRVTPGQQVNVAMTPGAALGGALGGVGGVFGTVNGIQPIASPTFVTGNVVSVDRQTGALILSTPFGEQLFNIPSSAVNVSSLRMGDNVRLGLSGARERSFTSVTSLGATSAPVTSTFATPAVTAGSLPFTTSNMPAPGRTTVGPGPAPRTTVVTGGGVVTGTGIVPGRGVVTGGGVVTSGGVMTGGGVVSGGGIVAGAPAVVPGAAVTAVPPTTANFAGSVPSAVGGVAGGGVTTGPGFNSPLGGQVNAGFNSGTGFVGTGATNAGVGSANIGLSTGTLSFPTSPFAQVIPSLPSVTGQLNVVPPPTTAPALPETLPVGAARDYATRDYDYAVQALALKANEIDAHWFRYRDGCLRSSSTNADIDRHMFGSNRDRQWYGLFSGDVRTPADDNCRQLMIEMTRMATDWRNNMSRVEDTARANDVLPGAMREIRQRYRVEF
jgi:hypothetical protein